MVMNFRGKTEITLKIFRSCPILLLFISTGIGSVYGVEPSAELSFQVGEELSYDVRWRFLGVGNVLLGNAKVSVIERLSMNGSGSHHFQMDIRSNPRFAYLVRFYHTFDSFVNDRTKLPVYYFSHSGQRPDDLKLATRYNFDYANRKLLSLVMVSDDKYEEKIIPMPDEPVYDGTSLFFHIRDRMRSGGGKEKVATIISGGLVETELTYLDGRAKLKDKDGEIEAFRINGKADYTGPADLRDGFQLWLSAEGDAVLLRAELKIFLGAIVATLREHKVGGVTKVFKF